MIIMGARSKKEIGEIITVNRIQNLKIIGKTKGSIIRESNYEEWKQTVAELSQNAGLKFNPEKIMHFEKFKYFYEVLVDE